MKRVYQSTTLMTLFVSVSGILTGIILNRALGPENRGILTNVTFWQPLIGILMTLGIHEALSFYCGRYPNSSKKNKLITAQFFLNALLSALGIIIGFIFIYFFVSEKIHEHIYTAYIYLTFIPVYILTTSLQGIILGEQNYKTFNAYRFLQISVYLLGIIFLFLTDTKNIQVFALLFLVSQILSATLFLKPAYLKQIKKPEIKYCYLLLKKGGSFYLPFILGIYSTQWDMLVVVKSLSFTEIGLYQAAYTIANSSCLLIAITFQYLVFPIATRIDNQQSRVLFIIENYFLSLLGLLLLSAAVTVLAPWIIPLLFGIEFNDAAPTLQLLVWGYALVSAKTVASRSIKALSEGRLSGNIEALYTLLFAMGIVTLMMTETFSIMTLCYTVFGAGFFSNLYFIFKLKSKYALKWREILNLKKAIAHALKSLS